MPILPNPLIQKYNVPVPRYTSYPTVPFWQKEPVTEGQWREHFKATFDQDEAISLYIHLPFCESMCTFCGCNKRITKQHSVELPYIQSLLKEWNLYLQHLPHKPTIKEIHLGGGTPTFFAPENLQYLLEGILNTADISEHHEFGFEAHPSSTSNEHLQVLYNLGFRRISIGVQDFDNEILKIINRHQPYQEVERVTSVARKLGYTSINFDLVFGLPLQTSAHIRSTIEKVKQLRPERIAFYSYAHVPWVSPGQRAYSEADLATGSAKRMLYTLGCKLLQENGYQEIGMDHFALPQDALFKAKSNKNLHRNFMGYTPLHTNLMIGLGASSISDSWTTYVQNVKKIEEYQALVNDGKFPIYRGHLLSKVDQIIRKHILELMCHSETDLSLAPLSTEHKDKIFKVLKSLEEDGLVNLKNQTISVSENGLPFIRNICAALDLRMQDKRSKERLFSQAV